MKRGRKVDALFEARAARVLKDAIIEAYQGEMANAPISLDKNRDVASVISISEFEKVMNLAKIIDDLRKESQLIDEAIGALAQLTHTLAHRRGRPPAWLKAVKKRRGRPRGSKNKKYRPPDLAP